MRYNVARELKQPGVPGSATMVLNLDSIEYSGRVIPLKEPVTLTVTYVYDSEGFDVSGEVKTVLLNECARCLAPFEEPMTVSFQERFVREKADPDAETYQFEGEWLDFSELVRDCLLLNIDTTSMCSEACKGLCPVCGCDLNTSQCSCEIKDSAPKNALHGLKALLEEKEEV